MVVSRKRFVALPGQRQHPGARRPVWLVLGEMRVVRHRVERDQRGARPMHFAHRHGAIDRHNRRLSKREQRVVQLQDRLPVGAAGQAPHRMRRLHRGFKLEPADTSHRACLQEQRLRLVDHRSVPARRVLFVERHEFPGLVAPRRPPRPGMEHQRQEAQRFRRIGLQRHDEAAEPDRFLGEVARPRHRPGGIGPAGGEHGIDRIEHGVEPLRQFVALRHPERNPRRADLAFCPHQALAHGRRRHQERGRNRRSVEPEHGLQNQRRARRFLDRGMRAGEHEAQPVVGNVRAGRVALAHFVRQNVQHVARVSMGAAAPRLVDGFAPRHCKQPRLRGAGHALRLPHRQRGGEGLGQRVLCPRHVAGAGREIGDQPAVTVARGPFDGTPRAVAVPAHHIFRTGRTSITPVWTLGQRAAQLRATSRSLHSMR